MSLILLGAQSRQSAKLFLQSSELGLPQPLTRRRECPPWLWGEGHTRWRGRSCESPNSDEGTYTVVLFIYTYFVAWGYLLYNFPNQMFARSQLAFSAAADLSHPILFILSPQMKNGSSWYHFQFICQPACHTVFELANTLKGWAYFCGFITFKGWINMAW